MAEFDRMYASNGKGNAALSLGIIGTGLAALSNGGILNNGLGGIFGGGNVNKFDDKIDSLKTDLMREKSERYTDKMVYDLRVDMYNKFDSVNNALNGIALVNNTTANTLSCLTNTVNNLSAAFNNVTITGISSSKVLSSSSSNSGSGS